MTKEEGLGGNGSGGFRGGPPTIAGRLSAGIGMSLTGDTQCLLGGAICRRRQQTTPGQGLDKGVLNLSGGQGLPGGQGQGRRLPVMSQAQPPRLQRQP